MSMNILRKGGTTDNKQGGEEKKGMDITSLAICEGNSYEKVECQINKVKLARKDNSEARCILLYQK